MNYLLTFLTLVAGPQDCRLINASAPSYLEGLSPFWAQEIVGVDLARETLVAERPLKEVMVADLDSGFEPELIHGKMMPGIDWASPNLAEAIYRDHGTHVANLINGPLPVGAAENAVLGPLVNIGPSSGSLRFALNEVKTYRPDITNLETHLLFYLEGNQNLEKLSPEELRDIVRELGEHGLVVATAGNYYPQGSKGSKHLEGLGTILVGSMNPRGWVSGFSDESEFVSILAPSDHYLASYGKGRDFAKFGGTSGAAPLVSGSLANVYSLLPNLTQEEASVLLRETAFTTATTSLLPQKNGAGFVNALKLVEVAKRLRKAGWPKSRERLIRDPRLFDFRAEAKNLSAQAEKFLSSRSCDQKREGFRLLRKSALLDGDAQTFQRLISVYGEQGFPVNAQFYKNLDLSELQADVQRFTGIHIETTSEVRRMLKMLKEDASIRSGRNGNGSLLAN